MAEDESENEICNVCWLAPPTQEVPLLYTIAFGCSPMVQAGLYFALATFFCPHVAMFPERAMPSSTELASGTHPASGVVNACPSRKVLKQPYQWG